MLPRYSVIPDIINGYPLPDLLGVIMPEETVNLISNPSFELNADGYSSYNAGSLTRSGTWQTRGGWGLAITPNAGGLSGVYFGVVPIVTGQQYTFSLDIQGDPGKVYRMYFASTGGVPLSSFYDFIATGFKQRVFTPPYLSTVTDNIRLYLARLSYSDTFVYYTDGWQVENKAYPTSYCDGDMTSFLVNDPVYTWYGARHASASWRSAQTATGGKMIKFSELGMTVLAIMGLGMGPVGNVALPSSSGGAIYQNTLDGVRQFQVVANIQGSSQADLQRTRETIIDALKPSRLARRQPTLLVYQLLDDCGNVRGDLLQVPCFLDEGLQGVVDNNFQERLGLTFSMYLPMLLSDTSEGTQLGYLDSIANANYLLIRNNQGIWQTMNAGANSFVYASVWGPDGYLYVGGNFGSMDGVAGTAYLARWIPGTLTWESMGGNLDAPVMNLAFDSSGALIVAGNFTAAGGTPNTNHIARVNTVTKAWTAMGTGAKAEAGTQVRVVYVDYLGNIWVGGSFTQMGGVANTGYLARWTGAAWTSVGIVSDTVAYIEGDGVYIYITGIFVTAGGVTVNGIARYKLATSAWSAMGSGFAVPGSYGLVIKAASSGLVYVGGIFTSISGVSANSVAFWNGVEWIAMGSGITGGSHEVHRITEDLDGLIYIAGKYTTAGGITMSGGLSVWNGSAWAHSDIGLPGGTGTTAWDFLMDKFRNIIVVGFDNNGTAYASKNTIIVNHGSAEVRPTILLTGAGAVYRLKNETNGKTIYFNIVLFSGEKAILDLDKGTFTSNFRGNIRSAILPGSDMSWDLASGSNSIFFFMGSPDGNTEASIFWKDKYLSVDPGVR